MRKHWTGGSISYAFDNAYSEVSSLAEEMREAFENTPEQFKDNSGREREITAEWLEAMLHPSIPSSIAGEGHWIEW
jgi:hypothetical protein